MKVKVDVTIAVVNFNTRDLLLRCIRSIKRFTRGITYEIVVLDNASNDGSVEMMRKEFGEIKLIVNRKNLYATVGNNQILKGAIGKYCLVINPDIEFLNNAIFKMVKFLDSHPTVGAVSCRQVMKNGKTDKTCSRFSTVQIEFFESSIFGKFFKNPSLLAWYRYGQWDRKSSREVEVIPDTIMLSRRVLLDKIGYYDEKIDLFFMENDLCLRIKKAGFLVWHLGNVAVLHLRGQSTIKFSPKAMYKIFEADMFYYYRKHFGLWWVFLFFIFQSNRFYYLVKK